VLSCTLSDLHLRFSFLLFFASSIKLYLGDLDGPPVFVMPLSRLLNGNLLLVAFYRQSMDVVPETALLVDKILLQFFDNLSAKVEDVRDLQSLSAVIS
jgi:hypothetical protein